MTFSKTTEYSLRVMGYMALDESQQYTATELFTKLGIPYRYLRKQLVVLCSKGLLKSTQGKAGGYSIAGDIQTISLYDIVSATDGELFNDKCFFGFQACPLTSRCPMHESWEQIRNDTLQLLMNTKLIDIKLESNGSLFPN